MTTKHDGLPSGRRSQSPWVDLSDLFPGEGTPAARQKGRHTDGLPATSRSVSPLSRTGDDGRTSRAKTPAWDVGDRHSFAGSSPRLDRRHMYQRVPSNKSRKETHVRVSVNSSLYHLITNFTFQAQMKI